MTDTSKTTDLQLTRAEAARLAKDAFTDALEARGALVPVHVYESANYRAVYLLG